MSLLDQIFAKLYLPGAILALNILNLYQKIRYFFSKNTIHKKTDFKHDHYVVIAMYQKGYLRDDIKKLLKTLKSQNCYISVVNCLKLNKNEINSNKNLFDSYVERFNYGRDFGCYKKGITDYYKYSSDVKHKRFLILNDSLFYSSNNLEGFIKDLLNTNYEALGFSENHDEEYHLASFGISLDYELINSKALKKYWKGYPLSDMRKHTIRKGELLFSRAIKKGLRDPSSISALINSRLLLEYLNKDEKYLNYFLDYTTEEVEVGKSVLKPQTLATLIQSPVFEESFLKKAQDGNLKTEKENQFFSVNIPSFIDQIHSKGILNKDENTYNEIKNYMHEQLKSIWVRDFYVGSQFHHHPVMFMEMGCPGIKLDMIYRGLLGPKDFNKISRYLTTDESKTLYEMLNSRQYGAKSLRGWKQAAFIHGLI